MRHIRNWTELGSSQLTCLLVADNFRHAECMKGKILEETGKSHIGQSRSARVHSVLAAWPIMLSLVD